MISDKTRTFTCANCGGEFAKGWSHEEALAELADNFPGVPLEDCAQVCDDCWELMRPRGELPPAPDDELITISASTPISQEALAAGLDDPEAFGRLLLFNLEKHLTPPPDLL